jgi:hypothetical protein
MIGAQNERGARRLSHKPSAGSGRGEADELCPRGEPGGDEHRDSTAGQPTTPGNRAACANPAGPPDVGAGQEPVDGRPRLGERPGQSGLGVDWG